MEEIKVNEIIKARREELGYSLRELSEKIGVNSSTIMRWENGDIANMKRDKIVSLAEALRISPGVIMGWEDLEPKYILEEPEPDEFTQQIEEIMNKISESAKKQILGYAQAVYDNESRGEDHGS